MAIVSLADIKAELGITTTADDAMIDAKIDEAKAWLESFLGYAIETEFPSEVPADLVMAVKLQAAHLYENREATITGISIQLAPNGVDDVIRNRRNYAFE
ncbi:head-tail connector protein [Sinorhizobium medicae]|uniref:head-tail connector protein n=1 Tax=Sinorhizobium medicae TaxID=110321 RepID=UPI0003FB8BBD|nr:head-tail connector protein [Sinorhizobium medicae]RVQ66172.1 phage gp6-like head-tail connector protein [Sinorhizobium medicae]